MDKTKQANKTRERRLRAKYRRNLRVAVIICLVIGLAAGFVAGRLTVPSKSTPSIMPTPLPTATADPVVTLVPTDEPTAEPIAEPTVLATAQPLVNATAPVAPTATADAAMAGRPTATAQTPATKSSITVVPYGETQNFTVQALSDGTARKDNGLAPFEELNFSMRVTRYLSNDYYTSNYGSTHRLDAGTAGIEFELLLNDYMGDLVIDPNSLIKEVGVETDDGVVTLGYRFTDAEISGSDKITMTTNVPKLLYKRFTETDATPVYLTTIVQINGVAQIYKFELDVPEEVVVTPTPAAQATAMPSLPTLREGDDSEDVKTLQKILIAKGYLAEGSADGDFGAKTTEAVKKAQAALGIEVDGVAGPGFYRAIAAG